MVMKPSFFSDQEEARIDTLCGGHIPEMFQRELAVAIRNCLDINTPFKGKRVVTLKVELTTNESRDAITAHAITSAKLQPFVGESGTVFAAIRGDSVVAVTYRADQMDLPFEGPGPRSTQEVNPGPIEAPRKDGTNE